MLGEIPPHDVSQIVGISARPVAHDLAAEGDRSDGSCPRLNHSVKRALVCGRRDAAHSVGNRIDLVAFGQHVEGRKGQADLGPKRGDDHLAPPRALDGLAEVLVLPGIDARAVDLFHSRQSLADRRNRARCYETVIREGTPDDIRTYIDGALLIDLWDDLVLPLDVRRAWQPLIDRTVAR